MSPPTPTAHPLPPDRFDALYGEHPDGVFTLDGEGNLLRCNLRFEEMTGYSPTELSSGGLRRLVRNEDLATAREHTAAALAGQTRRFSGRGIRKGGSPFSVEVTE